MKPDLEAIRQSPRQYVDLETIEALSDYAMVLEDKVEALALPDITTDIRSTPLSTDGLERGAFELFVSDSGKWPGSVKRNGYGYSLMQTQQAWMVWEIAIAHERAK